MLRPDDEALLRRLEDEDLCERLFRAQAPASGRGLASPPARASGLVTVVAESVEGRAARAAALAGDLAPLLRALAPDSTRPLDPRLNHHLSLWFARLARAYQGTDEPAFAAAVERSLASSLALADEGAYLLQLATQAAGSAASPADVARVAADAPFALLRELGQTARQGAQARSPEGRWALEALHRVERAVAISGAGEATSGRAAGLVAELVSRAEEACLEPLADRLEELLAKGVVVSEGPRVFEDVRAAWEWTRRSRVVEHFALDKVTPVAWVAYKQPGWEPLGKLVRPLDPLVESLLARMEHGRTSLTTADLAYAAPVAQMLVFRSELSRGPERFVHLERALRICSSHRNARLVLSGLLCEEALRLLQGGLFARPEARAEAERHYARAKDLYPLQRRLDEVKRALGG